MGDFDALELEPIFTSAVGIQPSTSAGLQETAIRWNQETIHRPTLPIRRHNTPRIHHHHHHLHHRHHIRSQDDWQDCTSCRYRICQNDELWEELIVKLSANGQNPVVHPEVSQPIDKYEKSQENVTGLSCGQTNAPSTDKYRPRDNDTFEFNTVRATRAPQENELGAVFGGINYAQCGVYRLLFDRPDKVRPRPFNTKLLASVFHFLTHALHCLAMVQLIPRTEYEDNRQLPWKLTPSPPVKRRRPVIIEPCW